MKMSTASDETFKKWFAAVSYFHQFRYGWVLVGINVCIYDIDTYERVNKVIN